MKWRVLVGEKTTWKMCGRFEQARKDCFVQREVKKKKIVVEALLSWPHTCGMLQKEQGITAIHR